MGAINLLKTFSGLPIDANYFIVNSQKVLIIYDVPHLFKSIRNIFYEAGEIVLDSKKGKWAHLITLENKNKTTLHFNKITKLHVEPKFRSKMRVKLAAQILSNTVAAILKLLADSVENKEESKEILETAYVIEKLDRLFDCTNVSKNSFHHKV